MTPKRLLFVAAFIVWCLFSWPPDGGHILVGIFVAAIVALLLGEMVIRHPRLLARYPRRYVYFCLQYVPVFLWEVLKANLDVAYRVIDPRLPINPGIVKITTSLRSDIALTLLANSITLTPGTMSVDIGEDHSALYVHWIDVRTRDVEGATKAIAERFEKILRKVFEEGEG
ncbi:MAG: Na+/H+ antiporter subunit E [Candidatus Binatia bacterium]